MIRSFTAIFCFLLMTSVHPAWASPVTFQDDSGQSVRFEKPFERIISLYGAHTENLFSLGLSHEIVGVSESEDFPPEALAKPTFSYRDDPEKFVATRPDLVLIRPMIFDGYPRLVERLKDAGMTVVSLQPNTIQDVFSYWRRLGQLSGRESRAETMIKTFQDFQACLDEKLASVPVEARRHVYFEAIHSRMKTFSPDSIAMFSLKTAGGVNVATDARPVAGTNIAEYGKERILSHAASIDVFLAQEGPMNPVSVDQIRQESGFMAIKAVRENRIFLVDERLVSRPTLRLTQGVDRISSILYPNLFITNNHENSIHSAGCSKPAREVHNVR